MPKNKMEIVFRGDMDKLFILPCHICARELDESDPEIIKVTCHPYGKSLVLKICRPCVQKMNTSF